MPSRIVQKAISCTLAALFPLATFAADSGVAIVYPDRSVRINEGVLDRSQAVVEGDTLRTTSSGATIALSGATLQMSNDSEVVFHSAGARVVNGSLAVTTSRGLGSEVVNLHVEPAANGARYTISEQGSKLVIAAVEGAVRVTDGKQTIVVPQDKALLAKLEPLDMTSEDTQSAQGSSQSDQNNKNRKKKGAGAIPAAGVGVTLSRSTLVAIATIAAVGGGVAAYLLTNRAPSSPTK